MDFMIDQELEDHSVVAHNYAEDSANKIHSDDFASDYGFTGGLVPGVGVYAYMTVPVVKALGKDWLERGSMSSKFIKPIYDGEHVTVKTKITSLEPLQFVVSALNEAGELCAVAQASLPDWHGDEVHAYDYPLAAMPLEAERLPAEISQFRDNQLLGTLDYTVDVKSLEGEFSNFLNDMRDPLNIYHGKNALCHPALVAHQANQVLARNVDLGPWIHTASDVRHHALPDHGEVVSLRGKIAHKYTKRNHDIAVLDLALFGNEDRLLTHMTHTAIIKPALKKVTGA